MADTPKKRTTSKRSTPAGRGDAAHDDPEHLGSEEIGTAIISGLNFGPRAVQYSVVDGLAMFEGDICLGTVEEVEQANAAARDEGVRGVVLPGSQFRWPGGVVPYEIDPGMPDQQRVLDAIAHWHANTVIRFVLRTPANSSSHPNYVRFIHGNGCYSSVGMRGGRQDISMGAGCDAGRGIHEIGHAVGCWHEQSREDRDMFVTIHWQNIQQGKEHNFNQHISDGDDVGGYDYGSIMHYGRTAFTRNGQDTITPTNPPTAQIGQRTELSAGDRNAVASMYGAPPSRIKKLRDDGPVAPPFGIKKLRDDPPVIKKPSDDPPFGIKKLRDDGPGGFKKISDDNLIVRPPLPPFQRPFQRPGGLSPFLLATGHHADLGGLQGPGDAGLDAETAAAYEAALEDGLAEASAAVQEARRNVVALQTALTGATSELARAQELYDALVSSVQSM